MFHLDGIRPPKKTFLIRFLAASRPLIVVLVILSLFISSLGVVYSLPPVKTKLNFLKLFRSSGRYLILFQNNSEIRPSGGFIGSFAVLEQEKGKIKKIYLDTNIYKRDKLFTSRVDITPPVPLDQHVAEGKWAMRDSNWAVDFPEAAQKVAWFYLQEGGTEVDGVVAINATVFKDILEIIGPIELSQYGLTISKDNFFKEIQYQVEKAYYEDPQNKVINEPKTILKDLLAEVLRRIAWKENRWKILLLIGRELEKKQILFYFKDPHLEEAVLAANWAGKVQEGEGDYLFINHANLGFNKSSLEVKEEVELKVAIQSEKILNRLRMIRLHQGTADWPSGDNKNYTRILLPLGSKILAASYNGRDYSKDIEVKEEAGKTVFAFWLITKVQSSTVLEITYEVPKSIKKDSYSLFWQKQPGTLGDQLKVEVEGKRLFEGWVDRDTIIR